MGKLKHINEKLDYYQLILENTRDVIYLLEVTEDGRFIHIEINQAHVDVTGIPRDDVIGKYVDEFENESFKEILLRKYGSCLSAGIKTEFIGEYDFPGGLKIFHSILTPIYNESGRITNIMGVARDITEKKRNDDRLRLYFERQLIGMAITSPSKGWIQSNEKLQQMMGYTHEELTQLTWEEMTHPDDLLKDMEQFKRLISAEIEDYMMEKRFIRKDGTIIHTKLSISCVRNIDQTIDYVLALIEDITEHKQRQKLLATREQEFRALAEKNPDTIARYDLNCIRTYANPSLYALTGLCTEEILGKKPTDSNYSVQAITYEEKLTEAMKTGFEAELEYSWPNKIGEMITSHIRIIPEKDANGTICSALAIGRDITKLKLYEATLKQKETRLKQAQKVAKIGSLEVVFPGLKIDFSDETLRIFEIDFNVSSFSYDHLLDVVHPDDRAWVDQKLAEAIEKKVPYETDHRLLFREGRIKYVRQKWETLYDNNENPVRSIGTVQDITAYKEQKSLLEQSEYEYRTLVENHPDLILRYDRECRRIYINPSFQKLCNHSLDELLGKTPLEHSPLIAPQYYMDELKKVIASGITSEIEVAGFGSNGEIRWFLATLVPEYNVTGVTNVTGVLCVARNITQAKEYESALKKSADLEKTMSRMAENLPGFVYTLRKTTDGHPSFPYVSSGIYTLFGLHPKDVSEDMRILYNFIHIDDRPDIQTALETSASQMSPCTMTFRVQKSDGIERWVEAKAIPKMETDGSSDILWHGVMLDVTERILQQQKLSMMEYFLDNIQEELFLMREKGEFEYVNQAACHALGYSQDELTDKGVMDIDPNYRIENWDAHWSYIQTNRSVVIETAHTRKDGSIMPIEVHANYFEFGGTSYNLAIVHDITERKEIETRLKQNEINLKEAQKIAKIGSWELEFPGLNLSWSDEIFRIFEIDRDNVQPSYDHFLNSIHPDDREQIDITFSQSLINKTPYDIVHRLLLKDKKIKYVHEKGYTLYDAQGEPLKTVGTVQDISERKMIEQEIEFLAHHDALTQLPNRILAKHRANLSIEFAKRHDTKTALLFIDLDGFKTVNDFLGHSAGDTMLKIIASRLQSILRESDTISRQGGDEFLFILSDIKEMDDIITITEKILNELQKPFDIGLHTLSASASIGISIYPEHGDSFEQLLQNADTAMYKAKESGKNTYSFYTEEMNHSLIEQFQIQNDLKSALQNNEFILFYQPQIDLVNNRIIGAEALIRWQHPQLGMVPPMSFIPIAESSGQIIQIGQWVIKEACKQGALWHKQGIEITIAVNISAIQFKRGNLETVVKDALISSGLNPKFLELELTETIMMHDAEMAIESVSSLKKLGVQISIDDFGTGYSSLGYLKRFSVDKLKIDQSFVRDILSDQDDAVIVNTIIQMAKNLNLKTIAEGVENAEVLDIINSYGCDEVQGYHFAKPMEVSLFEEYYTSVSNISQ